MRGRAFVDTNVVVYAFDDGDPDKRDQARRTLAEEDDLVVSTQVLGEFYVAAARKLGVPIADVEAAVTELARLPVVPTDTPLVLAGARTARAHQISYWDALIVEAAATAGCERLLTEDLADGAVLRGVRIENPFTSTRG